MGIIHFVSLSDNYKIAQRVINNTAIEKVGDLKITSGKLVIGDFGNSHSALNKLVDTFPIGVFPVYYIRFADAGTFIFFDVTKRAVKWKCAKFDTKVKKLIKNMKVDSGRFSITDQDGQAAIIQNEINNLYPNDFWWDEILTPFLAKKYARSIDIPIANSQNNIITTNTELGAGLYSAYIGYDKNRDIVCLFTQAGPAIF